MNLKKKKALASKALNIGKNRIIFNNERLTEIKEAITRQDIKDLFDSGAISIGEINGRKQRAKRKTRRRLGSIKIKKNKSKRDYINLTRKLRRYIHELLDQGKINKGQYYTLRKHIKSSAYKSKAHLKENLTNIQNG